MTSIEAHKLRVTKIVNAVQVAARQKQAIKINHGSSNSTRLPNFKGRYAVDTSTLSHIIEVNDKEGYVWVEPSVQMDELVAATLKQGMVPPVVMEFPGISVGGGIQGGAAESSSFKYGGFHETALEYEMILGDGSIVNVSEKVKPELFWGTACSYGSLGIITLVKLRLVPARPYVKLTYQKVAGQDEALKVIDTDFHDKEIDFIDGILFSPSSGVIMAGRFADKPDEAKAVTFMQPKDDWFYLHAREVIKKSDSYEEYIPITDYLFRYDRGAFWIGEVAFKFAKIPFTKLTRKLLDTEMHTRALYHVVHKTDLSQRFIVQDIFMPPQHISKFINYITSRINIWPLWLLPMLNQHHELDINGLNYTDEEYLVNIGVWGKPPTKNFAEFKALNREIEDKLPSLQAHKTLYAHSYYPKDKFWQIYDKTRYDALRKKYHAEGVFDNIYDKVTVREQYKASLGKAVLRHFKSKFKARERITGGE